MHLQVACVSHLLLLAVLAGSSLAVFYTKGKDTDYPRIGRRSFYTSGPGNHYPRIGRRSGPGMDSGNVNPRLLLLGASPEGASAAVTSSSSSGSGSSTTFSELPKRGVFTQGRHGYPRVGRRSGDGTSAADAAASIDLLTSRRHQILERLAEFKDEAGSLGADPGLNGDEEEVEQMDPASAASSFPLEIMFMAFDNDGDGKLSKDEFASGMRKYRQQSPLC